MIYTLFIQQILLTECLQCGRQHSGPGIQPLPFGAYSQGRRYYSYFQIADAIVVASAGKSRMLQSVQQGHLWKQEGKVTLRMKCLM